MDYSVLKIIELHKLVKAGDKKAIQENERRKTTAYGKAKAIKEQ